MAVHSFVCECGVQIEDTTTKGIHICPNCKSEMAMDCRVAIHGNYRRPIHSDALGIMPSQIKEHKKLFPDIELDNECRPIFDNFTRHEAYLKKTGFVKEPQKIRRTGAKRIA